MCYKQKDKVDIGGKQAYEILWGIKYFHSFCFVFFGGGRGVGEGGFTTLRNKCLEKNVQFPLKVTLVITSQFVEHSAATVGKGVILLKQNDAD